MAQSLEQINQALQQLEQQAIDIGEKLHLAHQGYRNVLAQSALEQLIMSCFTLCTEAYPEKFLALSVGDRHDLQQSIRDIAQQMQQRLQQVPAPDTPIEELVPAQSNLTLPEMLSFSGKNLLAQADPERDSDAATEEILILEETGSSDSATDAEQSQTERSQQIEAELKALFSLESLLGSRPPQPPQNPVEKVGFWHEQIEAQAKHCLREVSSEINQLFQQRQILPSQIPAPILEAAALADGSDSFGKTPHLVRMVLEAREKTDTDDREPDSPRDRRRELAGRPAAVVKIITLQLRINELEFHDTNLISWRNQIRTLLKQLETITRKYRKKQHQQSIANAKVAWRSTWTND